jgi:hypothetical protein
VGVRRLTRDQMKDRLVGVDCNKIPRFLRFVTNHIHGSATIFWAPIFRVLLVLKPIRRRVVRS